ncbi:Ldh family oxidoreductase [Bacillus sp. ISL-47]|uniref:Ldh family oxidoreductase n=1 Tax=Bacillus sp. ISL-47 TaxID=2819130 RepID=UPI001BE784DA|nr:Ldh family oxidoreductase [Bacillus sp. ISL-47]MBT2686721.1 Ldh family oxidoreductase [Bacillus sp. ISL-47]MBT2706931.1 Ldh family oxidoreductase [Pseudomonas sp. ISL-84]
MYKIQVENLKLYCKRILIQEGLPEEEAEIIAESLVEANEIGVDSHGVTRLSDYITRLRKGLIENKTNLSLVRDAPSTALYDANNGWGQFAGKVAMEKAIEKAKKYGCAVTAVRNSNHFGTAAYFAKMAAEEGCLGFVTTNASPLMVAWGSKKPTLGTNPVCIAVPTNQHPVVLDMATSTVARGKITLAAKNKQTIPQGWAITEDGNDTTNAEEALKGFLLPFGAKGSGLGMMVDIMSGVMTGALFGEDIPLMYDGDSPQQLGHLFIVINISHFIELETFKERMDERIRQTIESPPAQGFERVFMPGDIEQLKKEAAQSEGLNISEAVYSELKKLGEDHGLAIEEFMTDSTTV